MTQGLFITGTDTDCGKTEITLALMQGFRAEGKRVLGMKPVASGAALTENGLRNDDAVSIRENGSWPVAYADINPYAFVPAIAPHLAAQQVGVEIDLDVIAGHYVKLANMSDCVIVEGVGGWRVPLNRQKSVADLAVHLNLPVILVVGMRLGCINHALLNVESIFATGAHLSGWVANQVDPDMAEQHANLHSLRERINAPLLGQVPWMDTPDPSRIAACLDIRLLFCESR